MLKRYFLVLLLPISMTSCSSPDPVNSSSSQPVNVPPVIASSPSNTVTEAKSNLDVWSTEIEICNPSLLTPCYPIKANTLGKPTEIGFLYSRDKNKDGVRLSPTQAALTPLAKMPVIIPQKGLLNKSEEFTMGVFLKSNGVFSGLEMPSATPNFFPLKFSAGYYGTPETFYKNFDGYSYTIKSMTQLDGQQQASITVNTSRKKIPLTVSDPSHVEFQPKDIQEISAMGISFKPQQVEPIVVGQKVGLKKW
jgi:hypothetical protein